MAWPIVGKAFSPAEFEAYVKGLTWDKGFGPQFLVVHNTAAPCLADRPKGLTKTHIKNLETYYKSPKPKGCGWAGGPHLFIDDKQIWVFNPLTERGVHSPSWNSNAIGIEMLGDFDKESFTEGRGRKVRDLTVLAMAILNNRLGFAPAAFKFHIEDKKTNHACPGKLARAERAALVFEIEAAMAAPIPAPQPIEPKPAGPVVAAAEAVVAGSKAVANATTETVKAAAKPGVFQDILNFCAILAAGAGGLFGWAWEKLNQLIGFLPDTASEVSLTLEATRKISTWFNSDPLMWVKISAAVAAPLLLVALARRFKGTQ